MVRITGILALALAALLWCFLGTAQAEDSANESNAAEQQVIQSFTSKETVVSEQIKIPDQRKRQIMFLLGVPLLLLILATVSLGIAMGVYGKQVYIAHMVCAGLSLTLALAHAVVGIVWFYPF